jgi:hypothetical protein
MVAGKSDELNAYLGFDIVDQAEVPSGTGKAKVIRKKSTGDWRHWFTDTDVAHYRAGTMRRYMETFGYDHDDWALHPAPCIDPDHGSRYARNLFDDHRRPVVLSTEPAAPAPPPLAAEPMASRSGRGLFDRLRAMARAR